MTIVYARGNSPIHIFNAWVSKGGGCDNSAMKFCKSPLLGNEDHVRVVVVANSSYCDVLKSAEMIATPIWT